MDRAKKWRLENPEKYRAFIKRWEVKNRDRINKKSAEWRSANKEKVRLANKKWADANREKVREKNRRLRRSNVGKYRAYLAKYKFSKRSATPQWRNQFFIEEIYDLAILRTKYLGIPYQVDHIVPLQSKLVCGLHCEQNLRVIPRFMNISKSNRTWPDMP